MKTPEQWAKEKTRGGMGFVTQEVMEAIAKEIQQDAIENNLTPEEQNFVKDLIKGLSNNPSIEAKLMHVMKIRDDGANWDKMCDSIFKKLQNGRLTVIES